MFQVCQHIRMASIQCIPWSCGICFASAEGEGDGERTREREKEKERERREERRGKRWGGARRVRECVREDACVTVIASVFVRKRVRVHMRVCDARLCTELTLPPASKRYNVRGQRSAGELVCPCTQSHLGISGIKG